MFSWHGLTGTNHRLWGQSLFYPAFGMASAPWSGLSEGIISIAAHILQSQKHDSRRRVKEQVSSCWNGMSVVPNRGVSGIKRHKSFGALLRVLMTLKQERSSVENIFGCIGLRVRGAWLGGIRCLWETPFNLRNNPSNHPFCSIRIGGYICEHLS